MKKILRFLLFFLIGGSLLAYLLFTPTDSTPYQQQAYYARTLATLDSAVSASEVTVADTVLGGWAKCNITPDAPTKLMGYGWKGDFTRVHDSLWVRTLVFQQGQQTVAVVSYDLMLTPPAVAQVVKQRLADVEVDHVYFSATHTHHGFGEWQAGPAGWLITGRYDAALVDTLTARTLSAIRTARRSLSPVSVAYRQYDEDSLVSNRLVKEGITDPYLRAVYVRDTAGRVAVLCSFSAHATYLSSRSKKLSGDYPTALVRQLEQQPEIDFALFAAGAVGSHRPVKGVDDHAGVEAYAHAVAAPILRDAEEVKGKALLTMEFLHLPLLLGEPQFRVSDRWRVRPWVFRWFFGAQHPELSFFRLGDIMLVGVPADFSGMLYPQLRPYGFQLMVTSFNGNYVGYIIPEEYYGSHHQEARETNWYGLYTGSYTVALINEVLGRWE